MQNNKLINNYQLQQQQNQKVQNNLLQRNQLFMNNMNTNSSQVLHAQQLQQMHQLKLNQNQNKNPNTVDKDKIKEILIKPIKLEKGNKLLFEKTFKEKESEYKPKLEEYWKKKTNVPYKGILKNENYNLKVKDEKDLVVHRVTQKDKDVKEVESKYNEFNDKIKSHDGELNIIYSTSKKGEHKKKFEYTHTYQYRKTELNNSDEDNKEQDHTKLKQDRYNYYKDQQKQLEKNKKINEVLERLANDDVFDDVFSPDELSALNIGKGNNTITDKPNDDKPIDKKQMYLNRKNGNK
jgi:hypothetical protein